MNQNDFSAFSSALSDVADYYRQPLKPAGIQIYWNALLGYELATVRHLLSEHVKASKFMPAVSEILDRIKAADGRPGPEEAWAMIPHDEASSVVWTEEMAEAFGVVNSLLSDGETIQARMAFLERYKTLVREARDAGRPVRWTPSLGHDSAGREAVLIAAQRAGRLTQQHVAGLLPHHEAPSPEVAALLPDMTAARSTRTLKGALAEARGKEDAA